MNRTAIVFALFLVGCGEAPVQSEEPASEALEAEAPTGTRANPFVGHGTIQQIEEGQLVIAHDDIPGFMTAMTMAYPITEDAVSDSLSVGDEVTFGIEKLDLGYQIFYVEKTAAP